jgi:hypothetical protein
VGVYSYQGCNAALNKVFFDGRFAGQPVYLTLDNDMRQEIAEILDCDPNFVEKIICNCVGKFLRQYGNPYDDVLPMVQSWRRTGMKSPPPFTAILFCLAHAASLMATEGNFASSNYYLRLSQITGLRREYLSQHGNSTEPLWEALKAWLLQNIYSLGKPTAAAKRSRLYVGKAISQAVVRAGDRHLFHGLFERYGFSGSESIASKEMEFYMSHWIMGSGANERLRNVWAQAELRERVAEIALAELSKWGSTKGVDQESGGVQHALRLSLLANFVQKFPRQVLELNLGRSSDGEQLGSFQTAGSPQKFMLSNDRFGSYATLTPSPIGTKLGQRCQLQATETSQRGLDWAPRLVIPLVKSDHNHFWTEVSKVSFGIPHVILVRDANSLPGRVESYLAKAALKEPEKATTTQLPGLPIGWILYKDVQVRQLEKIPDDDLECLVPWSNNGALSISGGMRLLQGFYHSSAPVTLEFVANEGPTRIEVWTQDDVPSLLTSSEANEKMCALQFNGGNMQVRHGVRLKAFQGEQEQASIELHFRNSDAPHPLNRDGKGRLAYRSILSASTFLDGESGPSVVGLEAMNVQRATALKPIKDPSNLPQGTDESDQDPILSLALDRHIAKETCIERGYHYWHCETLPPGKPRSTPLEQKCRDCSMQMMVLHRGKSQASWPSSPFPIQSISQPKQHKAEVDADRLFDALCFLGHGNWGKFQELSESESTIETHHLRQLAQDMFLLGLIDVELGPGTNSVKNWSVPQASVNFIEEKKAFLSGYRSPSLTKRISDAIAKHGGKLVEQEFGNRPRLIWIEGIDFGVTTAAISEIKDPLDRRISILEKPAHSIASAFSGLKSLREALQPVSIGRPRGLQNFDVRTARWVDTSFAFNAGAYRWNEGFQCYAYLSEDGSAWSGPHQIVKALAASALGISLWQYDAGKAMFRATLGCEPPGLLGRALVACSGQLPELGRGLISYSNVSPHVASNVMLALSMENLDEGGLSRG